MKDTIKKLAEEIRVLWPELLVTVQRGYCDTDRKIGRLRHPGKGRTGARLIVQDPRQRNQNGSPETILDHNNAETYRTTRDVREWMERYGREVAMRRKR